MSPVSHTATLRPIVPSYLLFCLHSDVLMMQVATGPCTGPGMATTLHTALHIGPRNQWPHVLCTAHGHMHCVLEMATIFYQHACICTVCSQLSISASAALSSAKVIA